MIGFWFELWLGVLYSPLGGVDGQVLGAGGLANGFLMGGIWAAGGRCLKPIKQTFICKHWFYGFDW